jgi:hypothetical protein
MIERLTLKEAGELLNISPDALRMRIRRGTMNGEKDEEGKWYVRIDTAELEPNCKTERSPNGESDDMETLRRELAVLQARLELIEDERDFLRKQVQALTIAQTQKAIEGESHPRRRWRWPWER